MKIMEHLKIPRFISNLTVGANGTLILDRPMKWVVESSPAAVTRRSGKTATLRLSGGCHPTERGWMEVRRVLGSFILRSAQQEEALHRIWYALRRWRLVSRRIVLFPTTACSSINRR
ncbi:unnamed protein product [Spirodela intermedia]|uniref:Uncharacterized protein n=1 Tax=Spirodela intermedia TaxID=51605 RepID=A0ABN7EAR5_SPIIN|nr:unnamed protein product [Spirodela intermedia]